MHSRRAFWARAAVLGWHQVVSLKDHLELATLLSLAGLGLVGISIKQGPSWLAPAILLLALALMVLDGAYIQWRDADNKAGGENAGLPAAPDEVDAVIAKLSVHTMVGAGDLDEFLRRNRSWFLRGFNHVTVQSRLWGVDNPLDEFASQAILEELQLLELIEIEARVPDKSSVRPLFSTRDSDQLSPGTTNWRARLSFAQSLRLSFRPSGAY